MDNKNNTGENNSGDGNSGDGNSGNRNSGNWNSGNWNSGDGNSGNWNSGNRNSGNWNSGDGNSGIFNTDEPKMRAFNKKCNLTYTEFREKYGYKDLDLPICSWIDKEDMTDQEKKDIEGWETMGGYLKTLSYKEAWKKAWSEASEEQKDWYKSFPNFSASIFKEITGIDIEESDSMEIKVEGKVKFPVYKTRRGIKTNSFKILGDGIPQTSLIREPFSPCPAKGYFG